MRIETKIQKWGNGLALRVSGVMRDIPHFQEGTIVDVDVTETGFVVKKHETEKKNIFPFREDQLLEDMTSESVHADLLASPLVSELPEK